jgi:hypothetical protein
MNGGLKIPSSASFKTKNMKPATDGQLRELFAKLLTKAECKKIDFDQIQKFIKDPDGMMVMFTFFINHGKRLPLENLVVATRCDHKMLGHIKVQAGDTIVFNQNDRRIHVERDLADNQDNERGVYFLTGESWFDMRSTTNLSLKEFLLACAFHGCFIGCAAVEQERQESGNTHEIAIKFVSF